MTPGVPPRAASMMPSMVWIILLFLLVSIHKKTVALVYHSDHIIQRCTGPVNEKTPNGSIKFHTAGTWVWPPQKKTPYPVRIGGAAAGRFSYFRLCATATATATVAPTMGLLPMPKKPIIALSYCLVFLALLSFSYSQFSFASLYVDKVWTRICPQSNLTYLYNIILLHNYKTQQNYLSAILGSYRLFSSLL